MLASCHVGCIVLDEEHCLANGGDLACPGQLCLIEAGKRVKSRTDALGCTFHPVDDDRHLHARYGLPAAVELTEGDNNLDTVEGILIALREDHGIEGSCPLDGTVLQDEFDEVIARHADIDILRARMEKRWRVRTGPAKLTQEEVDSVVAYNKAVQTWLDACLEKAASEM